MPALVSVVVPFYNEQDNLRPLYEEVARVFAQLEDYDLECVFVNDGSSDATRSVLDDVAAADARVRALHLAGNRGQSAAILAGMRNARGEYILTLDGDLQNDPADFPRFLELLQDCDCVCGYRANRRDAWVRRVSSRVANRARNALLHDGIRDTGCGAKGFRRVCVRHIPCFNGVHRFLAVFIRSAGLSIVECPVNHRPRKHGVSKYGIGNRLWRGIHDLFGVRWLRKRFVTYDIEGEG